MNLTPLEVRDTDRDGIISPSDNCPHDAGADQNDNEGDAC
jgi:hypothetical protein